MLAQQHGGNCFRISRHGPTCTAHAPLLCRPKTSPSCLAQPMHMSAAAASPSALLQRGSRAESRLQRAPSRHSGEPCNCCVCLGCNQTTTCDSCSQKHCPDPYGTHTGRCGTEVAV
jgi:hypothetical protein